MKRIPSGGVCVAGVMALNMAVFAQAMASQTQAATSAAAQGVAADQQVTVIGCVQRETDYRRARDAGRGGVAGTGVGAGNEFVVINASMGTASGTAYELTARTKGRRRSTPASGWKSRAS